MHHATCRTEGVHYICSTYVVVVAEADPRAHFRYSDRDVSLCNDRKLIAHQRDTALSPALHDDAMRSDARSR